MKHSDPGKQHASEHASSQNRTVDMITPDKDAIADIAKLDNQAAVLNLEPEPELEPRGGEAEVRATDHSLRSDPLSPHARLLQSRGCRFCCNRSRKVRPSLPKRRPRRKLQQQEKQKAWTTLTRLAAQRQQAARVSHRRDMRQTDQRLLRAEGLLAKRKRAKVCSI